MSRSKTLLFVLAFSIAVVLSRAEEPHKHIVFQMRHSPSRIADVVVVTAGPADDSLNPLELLRKQSGNKFDTYFGCQVYRFGPGGWDYVMGRRVNDIKDLTVKQLQDGDVLILYHPQP